MSTTNSLFIAVLKLIAALRPSYISFFVVIVLLVALGLPTVTIQEGGYPTAHLSANLSAFMRGFTA